MSVRKRLAGATISWKVSHHISGSLDGRSDLTPARLEIFKKAHSLRRPKPSITVLSQTVLVACLAARVRLSPTYYGNGFSYQPAHYLGQAYYAAPRFRSCCPW